jgi:hypothetical protein
MEVRRVIQVTYFSQDKHRLVPTHKNENKKIIATPALLFVSSLNTIELAIITLKKEMNITIADVKNCVRPRIYSADHVVTKQVNRSQNSIDDGLTSLRCDADVV